MVSMCKNIQILGFSVPVTKDPVNKFACKDCFNVESIRFFIENNSFEGHCSYCNCKTKVTEIEKIISLTLDAIKAEYCTKKDLPPQYMDSEIPIYTESILIEKKLTNNSKLITDISCSIPCREWFSFFYNDELGYCLSSWQNLIDITTHHARFFFEEFSRIEEYTLWGGSPLTTLKLLAKYIHSFCLVKKIPIGTFFYRARVSKDNLYDIIDDLCPPPKIKALSSRMSPAGIPLFYSSDNKRTSILETISDEIPQKISIAKFESIKDLTIIDLTELPKKDFFSPYKISIEFLENFVKDVKKPITQDGMEHIEYVPTQIVTEFFRYNFDNPKLNGMAYPSSKDGEKCYAMFFSRDNFIPSEHDEPSNQKDIFFKLNDVIHVP